MTKSWLLLAAGVVAAGGTAGVLSLNQQVSAASGLKASAAQIEAKKPSGAHHGWNRPFMRQAMTDVAKALNLTPTALKSDLQSGDSIATIAKKNNVNVATVESTLLTNAKTAIQAAVAAGQLTSAQASTIEANLSSRIDTLVTESPRQFMGLHMMGSKTGMMRGLLKDAASALNISPATLKSGLQSGESLATIASNNKSSASALISTLVSDATAKLQSAVSSGALTQAQATQVEGSLTPWITTLVSQAPLRLPPGHRFGAFARGSLINDAASVLNMPVATLQSDLKSGESLASIAGSSKVSSLESTLVQDATATIQSAVKAGQLNPAMATKLESHLTQMIDQFVTSTGHPRGPGGWGPPPTPAP